MNLYSKIKRELHENPAWNYYGHTVCNPLHSQEDAKKFVLDYFEAGSKEKVLSSWNVSSNDKGRLFREIHTVNVFFIGVYLQSIIGVCTIKSNRKVAGNYEFPYLWYLTSLGHDLGYMYETKTDIVEKLDGELLNENSGRYRLLVCKALGFDIKKMAPNLPIDNRTCYGKACNFGRVPCTYKPCYNLCKGCIEFNNNIKIKKSWCGINIKENYFKYRIKEFGCIDHGIAGADMLYSNLIDNYIEKYKSDNGICFMEFTDDKDRSFSCEQFKIFAYISDCIACHNIYKADKERIDLYKKYGLEKLLPDNYKKISYEKNPLLFILCLADTLEPSKRFESVEMIKVLEQIDIEYSYGQYLRVKINESLTYNSGFEKYKKDIEGLTEWMEIGNIKVEIVKPSNNEKM